ncbi:MAG: tRNA (adenosine(37)-N6)-threonylcarbamoyltransferase complex transferase subunit TsaD [Deltaproteobacteria bacterium]|nr:tRNA (adenosine(37)-N6)-threonylcarbamoyltransferase complex transferase subunit TsaD [Deltaproteobacteria bacterium]
MKILAIESSCDDSAVAIVDATERRLSIRASRVHSQNVLHAPFGGVVPEIASRSHVEMMTPLVRDTLSDAGATLANIDAFAVTYGPGLVGSLLVGLQTAKALAYAAKKPFIGVHHLEGHIAAITLDRDDPPAPPFLALVASGGHTALYFVRAWGDYETVGQTRDDAAGEAFDKGAKLLGLGYPGGPAIERAAVSGNDAAIALPRALPARDSFDFSFSGLKTALWQHVQKHGVPTGAALADAAASLEAAIVDALVKKTVTAARRKNAPRSVLAGGVAANTRLRALLTRTAAAYAIAVELPPKPLCTDNAAMIAAAAAPRLAAGESSPLDLNAVPTLPLGSR